MGVHGPFFTWSNKQEGTNRVFSKIDRILCNDEWLNRMRNASATFVTEGILYHCPCVIKLDNTIIRRPRAFNYYKMWSMAEEFMSIVNDYWQESVTGTPMYRVVVKLKKLKKGLKLLHKTKFSNI